MDDGEAHLEKARQAADRVKRLLAQPATLDSYDWGLVAALVVGADDALRQAQAYDPSLALPLFDAVLEELRDASANFTGPEFLSATKAARRQRPHLFLPRR